MEMFRFFTQNRQKKIIPSLQSLKYWWSYSSISCSTTRTAECVADRTFINTSQIKTETAAARQIIGWESSSKIDGGRVWKKNLHALSHTKTSSKKKKKCASAVS